MLRKNKCTLIVKIVMFMIMMRIIINMGDEQEEEVIIHLVHKYLSRNLACNVLVNLLNYYPLGIGIFSQNTYTKT